MRILIYGLNFAPELTGIGKYTGEMAAWLADRGHEVRVVTAPPYYPAWVVHEEYRARSRWYVREQVPGGPTVFRCPLWVPRTPTGATRILHLLSFALFSLPTALLQVNWSPDVVFTVEPTFFSAPLAWVIAKISHAASWLHVQDFEVDAAFELSVLKPEGLVHWFAVRTEEWFTSHYHRVSSISQRMVEKAISKGVPRQKAVLFPNWVDGDVIFPMAAPSPYREELGLAGKTVLLYSGNMGGKQGLDMLAPLARACADDPAIHFVFCGDGPYRPFLQEEVAGLPNVLLLPLQPVEKLNALLNLADIHLLPQRAGAADLVMPSKLSGMLSSGRPVVATAEAGTQVAMIVEGCGVVVPPQDDAALEAAVRALAADTAWRTMLGEQARTYAVEHLDRDSVLEQFERDLKYVAGLERKRRTRAKPLAGKKP